MTALFSLYEQKRIRLIDDRGNAFTGVADTFPAEYGLHLGLRKADFQPKPVWGVWKAAGTDKEDEVFDPYLKVIGISSWDEIYLDVK